MIITDKKIGEIKELNGVNCAPYSRIFGGNPFVASVHFLAFPFGGRGTALAVDERQF